jgi:hypothetical protein
MTKSMKSLMMGAALAGFMAGNTLVAQTNSGSSNVSSADNGSYATDFSKDKHACKGQNSCKGKGGCKAGDNGCKGKNSCKGKGGRRLQGPGITQLNITRAGANQLRPSSIFRKVLRPQVLTHACQSL